jgi:hypothetical protein
MIYDTYDSMIFTVEFLCKVRHAEGYGKEINGIACPGQPSIVE